MSLIDYIGYTDSSKFSKGDLEGFILYIVITSTS